MRGMILFLTVALSATIARAVPSNNGQGDLELLCNNKPVELTRISQVAAVISALETSPEKCSPEIKTMILDLKPVIDDEGQGVCSINKTKHIQAFYSSYIQNGKTQLPAPLRSFFLAYGLRISQTCKKNMINSLLYDTHRILDTKDFETMELWTKNGNEMTELLSSPHDYDDLILLSEVTQLDEDSDNSGDSKIYIQTATGHLIEKMKDNCAKRFAPIYEALIMPLVALSNMGFDYQGEDLAIELKEMSTNMEVHQWYKMVYLCDSIKSINLVDLPESETIGGDEGKVIRILTEEEARELGATGESKIYYDSKVEQVSYSPEAVLAIDDTVIDKDDQFMTKWLERFNSHKTETDRIRKKVLLKIGSIVKRSILSGKVEIIGSMFGECFKDSPNTKEDVVKSIDGFVQESTQSQDTAVAYGLKQYARRAYHNAYYLGPQGIKDKVASQTTSRLKLLNKWFWRVVIIIIFIAGCYVFATALAG